MTQSPIMAALAQLAEEKNLPLETVKEIVEHALAAAYRKDYGRPRQIIRVELNEEDITKSKVFQVFNVIDDGEEVVEPENQLVLEEAKKLDKNAQVGGEIIIELEPRADFGRIAAQTAKQVIIQRLGEAERELIYQEFKNKEGQIASGTVQQLEGRDIIVSIGKVQAVLPQFEQIKGERYSIGQRLKVLILGVEETNRGPKVLVSRVHPNFIAGLFTQEVPELQTGTVKIEGIAREAGSRTKIAVSAHQEGLDPVGSCVGQRGIRVQAVLNEIGEEKIDIILFDQDPTQYITNALSPAKVESIKIDKKNKRAIIQVPDDEVSLAIGKDGQNVRLASRLTGWDIDILKDKNKNQPAKKDKSSDNQDSSDNINNINKEESKVIAAEEPKKRDSINGNK